MSLKTPLEMLYHWEDTSPNAVFLRQPVDGVVNEFTWRDTADQARRVAAGLIALNLPPASNIAGESSRSTIEKCITCPRLNANVGECFSLDILISSAWFIFT